MKIRNARIQDAQAIHALISSYAELDKMLFRSLADIYENLQIFNVAEEDGCVVGCCALKVIWAGLAEIKSLAVESSLIGRGIGRALVESAIEQAHRLGVKTVFTLTLEPAFFQKAGFKIVSKQTLPMKVWSDCAKCPKQDNCDETALVFEISD